MSAFPTLGIWKRILGDFQKIFKCWLLSFHCDSREFELPESLGIAKHLVAWLSPCGTATVCLWIASRYMNKIPVRNAEMNFN